MSEEKNVQNTHEVSLDNLRPVYKVWLESEDGYIFGSGSLKLLQKIEQIGTLSGASESLGMSYRHAWGVIKKIETRIGKLLLNTRKGGRFGGGGADLTIIAQKLIEEYQKITQAFDETCKRLTLQLD